MSMLIPIANFIKQSDLFMVFFKEKAFTFKSAQKEPTITTYSFNTSKINSSDEILKGLTKFSKEHKTACVVSIVALPILAILTAKIALFVSLGLSLGIILGLVYVNNHETTTVQKVTSFIQGLNPFKKTANA